MYTLLEKIRSGGRLTSEDRKAAVQVLDQMHSLLEKGENPPNFMLANGELAKGATGRIALNAYFLLIGRKLYGQRYCRLDPRMAHWKLQLGYHIMLGHFIGKREKGIYCCSTCTLSVLPLYATKVFDEFDNDELVQNIVSAPDEKRPPFDGKYSRKYADWALGFVK